MGKVAKWDVTALVVVHVITPPFVHLFRRLLWPNVPNANCIGISGRISSQWCGASYESIVKLHGVLLIYVFFSSRDHWHLSFLATLGSDFKHEPGTDWR